LPPLGPSSFPLRTSLAVKSGDRIEIKGHIPASGRGWLEVCLVGSGEAPPTKKRKRCPREEEEKEEEEGLLWADFLEVPEGCKSLVDYLQGGLRPLEDLSRRRRRANVRLSAYLRE